MKQYIIYCNNIYIIASKLLLKYLELIATKVFLLHKRINSIFIVTFSINYCNDSNVIAMIFFSLQQIFFFLVLFTIQVPFLLIAVNIPMQIYALEILNEMLKSLKSKKFLNLHQSTNTTNFAFDFASFHQPLANDDVIGFVDMLEHMSTNNQLLLLTIFSQKYPSRNSLLHEAASFGSTKITKFIVDHFPFLLTK